MFDIVEYLAKEYGALPAPRVEKVKTLFRLAYNCQQGSIVELGTYHGIGTAALCIGAELSATGLQVYTVDDFIDRKGWIGENYVPDDYDIFRNHMKNLELSPILIKLSARDAGTSWKMPIGVLFWDCGVVGQMTDDIMLWEKHVLQGGHIYLHDTVDRVLGSTETIEYLKDRYTIVKNTQHAIILKKEANHE